MEVKINLNEKVKFKLSERGKEIYRHRYDGYGFEYDREPKLDDDGYMSMQLWTFMQIFGEHMTMGMSEVVQPLEIIYEIDRTEQDVTESAMTKDCISRQALIDEILEDGNGAVLSYPAGMYEDELVEHIEKQMINHFIGVIKYASSVEPKRSTGEWIDKDGWPYCSNCEEYAPLQNNGCEIEPCYTPFCPWCGVDMKENDQQRYTEDLEHCMRYEPTYNSEDGSM